MHRANGERFAPLKLSASALGCNVAPPGFFFFFTAAVVVDSPSSSRNLTTFIIYFTVIVTIMVATVWGDEEKGRTTTKNNDHRNATRGVGANDFGLPKKKRAWESQIGLSVVLRGSSAEN